MFLCIIMLYNYVVRFQMGCFNNVSVKIKTVSFNNFIFYNIFLCIIMLYPVGGTKTKMIKIIVCRKDDKFTFCYVISDLNAFAIERLI